jgi:hypothetical protein
MVADFSDFIKCGIQYSWEYLEDVHEFGFTEHMEYAYKFDSLEAVAEYFQLAEDKFKELGNVELEVEF